MEMGKIAANTIASETLVRLYIYSLVYNNEVNVTFIEIEITVPLGSYYFILRFVR